MGLRVLAFTQKFAEQRICCQRQKYSPGTLVSGDESFMRLFTGVLWRGSVKTWERYSQLSHLLFTEVYEINNMQRVCKSSCWKPQHTFDVGNRQKMTDMGSKRTTSKCIATALVCQLCWDSCYIYTKTGRGGLEIRSDHWTLQNWQQPWVRCSLQCESKQEAQLLLGDRATGKHAKDCWNKRGNDQLGWNDLQMYFKVIKSGTNWKLAYDFLLVVYSNFCRHTPFLRNLMWNCPMTYKYAQGHWQSYHLKTVVWPCM